MSISNRNEQKEKSEAFIDIKDGRADFWTRRTKKPPYEIVGKLERYDLREILFSRSALVPGTEDYRAFYSQHPELEERDKKLRAMSNPEARRHQKVTLFSKEPMAMALSDFHGITEYLPDIHKFKINEKRVEMESGKASRSIKGVAKYLGADLVGITELNQAWVYSHWGANARDGVRYGEPIEVPHKYAIAIAIAEDFDLMLRGRGISLVPEISTIDAHAVKVPIIGLRLAAYIHSLGYPAECSSPGGKVQFIPIAVDAGLGEAGRNGLLITKEFGAAVRLTVVTTDLPMEVDLPVDLGIQDFCEKCTKCVDNCSSGSMVKGEKEMVRGVKIWPIDNERCLYLRLTHGFHSCHNCMSSCPWTKPHNIIHQAAAEMAARFSLARTALVWMDDFLYGRKLRDHSLPSWLQYYDGGPTLKEKIITLLHKV